MKSPLLAAYPSLAGRLPVVQLGTFPTAVERLDPLARALGLAEGRLFVKRDDRSGTAYGGNKVRKLEVLLADALGRGARRVVTVGAVGSNHVLATSIYGRAQGLLVDAILVPQPPTQTVRKNLLGDLAAGSTLRLVKSYAGVPVAVARALARKPGPAVLIPAGGSSPIGTLGYVGAAFELQAQIRAGVMPEPDVIYLPLGTGGTAAGLHLGLRLAGLKTRVCAVRVVDRIVANRAMTLVLARRAARVLARLGVDTPLIDGRALDVVHGFFGKGYGYATPAGDQATKLVADTTDLRLEPTYTAKTFAALSADAHAGRLDNKVALLWMTYSSADLTALLAGAPSVESMAPALRPYATPPE
jgi:1-aminocyclopropane-1-carboxylate deaminase/D-cysteine desulfhydrase-like pyridoxal-dependent ACC family enzyme